MIENKQKKIQGELSLKLESLSLLSGHDKIDDAWDDLKKVVASVISIQKINNYRTWISNYGVDWYKEYYKNEGDKDKVNPVRLIADVWSNSDKIGFDCSKKETELKEWKDYFDECDRTAAGVEGRNVRVVRVLKPTVTRDWKYYVPAKGMGTSWVSNKPIESSLKNRHSGAISTKGKLGELVAETCDQYWGLFSLGQDTFCREILQKFFGANVSDKRYCLYEMPEAEEDLTSDTFFKKRKND